MEPTNSLTAIGNIIISNAQKFNSAGDEFEWADIEIETFRKIIEFVIANGEYFPEELLKHLFGKNQDDEEELDEFYAFNELTDFISENYKNIQPTTLELYQLMNLEFYGSELDFSIYE